MGNLMLGMMIVGELMIRVAIPGMMMVRLQVDRDAMDSWIWMRAGKWRAVTGAAKGAIGVRHNVAPYQLANRSDSPPYGGRGNHAMNGVIEMQVTITLPDMLSVKRAGASVSIPTDMIPATIIARLVEHGLEQKIGDAAAGSVVTAGFTKGTKFTEMSDADRKKVTDTARALMDKVADGLIAGTWGVERTGAGGVSALQAEMRSIIRPLVKAKNANWKDLDEKDRVAKIDATIAVLTDDQRARVTAKAEAEIARKRAESDANKALLAGLGDIGVDLPDADEGDDDESTDTE